MVRRWSHNATLDNRTQEGIRGHAEYIMRVFLLQHTKMTWLTVVVALLPMLLSEVCKHEFLDICRRTLYLLKELQASKVSSMC